MKDNTSTAAAVPFDQGLTHQPALNIVRGLRAIYGTYPMVMEAAAEIERQLGANIVLLAGLRKICEPITAMGDADSVSACQDLHELICTTAQHAISQAALIEMPSKDKEDLIAERLADSLIDYIRAPYSRSWLVERINAAIKRDTGEALRPLGASGSEVPWSLTSAPPPPAGIKQAADVAARDGAVANASERVATPLPAPDAGWRDRLEQALKEIAAYGGTGREVIDPLSGEKTTTVKLSATGHLKCRMIARAALNPPPSHGTRH